MFHKSRFAAGFLIASLIFGGSAIAVNVNNTADGGYLLCANNKSRVVTYPGTLKCPSGTTPIEVPGGFNGQSQDQSTTTPSPLPTKPSGTSSSGDIRCTFTYIKKSPAQLSEIVQKCSSQQLAQLQKDVNTSTQQCSIAIPTPVPSGTSAEAKTAAVEAAASAAAQQMAECQNSITILAAVVSEIAKRLKA